MWSRLALGVGVVVVAGAVAWAVWPRPIAVETATIGKRDLAVTVEEEGQTRIREVFTLSAPVTGLLERVTVHPGDAVTAGRTVLASIRSAAPNLLDERARRIAEATEQAAAAAVVLAQAQVEQAVVQRNYAQAELDRTTALADRALVSLQVIQRAIATKASADQDVEVAQAGLTMRRRELESAQAALIEHAAPADAADCCTEIRAPVSGEVLSVAAESEHVVQQGAPLMDIGDLGDLEAEVRVLSSDAVRIRPGASATVEGWGGPALPAQVERIDPIAVTKVSALGIEEQRTTVHLRLLGNAASRAGLGHGFRVVARIVLWQGRDLVTVPMAALFRVGADWAVYAVEDGKARLREVQLGERNADFAQLTQGPAAGTPVIVHPADTVGDGSAVSPAP